MNIMIALNSRIPVLAYGGTQRVMWYLGKELSRMGHRVTFLAREGSECSFARVQTIRPDLPLSAQVPDDIDLVHFNEYVPEAGFTKPHVVTYHGNGIKQPISPNAIFVSRNHAERFGSTQYVYNGLDWDDYGPLATAAQPLSAASFHFLGNAAWRVKNVQGAIDVVKALPGARLEVLGGQRFNFKMGLRFTLTPKARFRGMVGGEEKLRYLRQSRGLIFPIIWDEPFGLAITESLYCGAPVFATPHGSLPELVTPEVGFLTDSKQQLIDHLRHGYHYSPRLCSQYAADLFNSRVMAEAYLQKYEQVLGGKVLNPVAPRPLNPGSCYSFR